MVIEAARRVTKAARRWRAELVIFLVVAVVCFADLLAEQQNAINDVTFQLLRRPASGDIVIVQIDSKSLSALDTWPWPRRTHAELIDRLIESGAEIVALDIDFSSASVPADDARLAQSIQKAAGHIVLPSFVQTLSPGVTSQLVETNPLPVLRDNALIGNANVFAPYGAARQGSLGMYLADGRYRPTFAALVAQRERAFVTTFDIDFGIDRATIPRLSYIDVLRGAFDPALVKGKRVIVGATAVELGDRVPVPLHGVVAGVEVQALTAESIWQNRMLTSLGFPGAMALVTLLLLVLRPSTAAWSIKGVGWRFAACGMALCVVPIAVTAMFPVVIDTAVGFSALILCLAFVGGREFSARAQTVLRERSANSMRSAMINLIVEESSDGVIVSDGHGRIELCNQRAGLLLSTTRSALLGRSTNTYLPRFEDMAEALCGDPLQRQCELMFEIDGNPLLLEVGARRLGKKVIAMATPVDTKIDVYTLRDVTAKRKAEEAERRANEERLLAERARSNFIANMSHELRTPLNAIIGFSEMMSAQVLGPMGTPAYVEYADVVAKSGHHLLSVVNNVLELSRMDSDDETPDVEEFDFNACANICVSLLRATRDYKGQTITVHPTVGNPIICAVSRLTKHVLINLLSNAVKFSEKDGNISVTSWNEGTQFGFEVSDDGAGIDPAVMPHLTTLFYHSNQSFTRKHDGLGVGLYLVKRALERMHGTLVFDSAPGKGTRVRVLLPRTVSEDEAAAA